MKTINIVIIAAIFMVACESNTYDDIGEQSSNPTYQTNISPIMTANCTSCHSAAGGQLPYLETYDQVKDAIVNGNLINEIEAPSGQGMPLSGRMPQTTIDLINSWAANGFTN